MLGTSGRVDIKIPGGDIANGGAQPYLQRVGIGAVMPEHLRAYFDARQTMLDS